MKQGLSKEEILIKARNGLFVSKYSYNHESLRKKTRRLLKEGLLKLIESNKDGFYYKLNEVRK